MLTRLWEYAGPAIVINVIGALMLRKRDPEHWTWPRLIGSSITAVVGFVVWMTSVAHRHPWPRLR